MKKLWIILAATMALFTGSQVSANNEGSLVVRDNANMFTAEGIKKSQAEFAKHSYDAPVKMYVVTYDSLPSKKQDEYKAIKDKKEQDSFITKWAAEEAKAEGSKGIFVLICANPTKIRTFTDEQFRISRKFGDAKDNRLAELLVGAFKAGKELTGEPAKQAHDIGLSKAVEYANEQLEGTALKTGSRTSTTTTRTGGKNMGSGILGMICMISFVVLGIWLVIGVIRALTGMVVVVAMAGAVMVATAVVVAVSCLA